MVENDNLQSNVPQGNTTIINNVINKSNGVGTAGFVLALIGLFTSWIPVVGWIIWILGAILSVVGIFKTPRGMAIAGTIISFIDVIILVTLVGAISSMF